MDGSYKKCHISSSKMPALQKGLQLGSFFLKFEFNCLFSMFGSLKKYPKISGYLDRISKIWIMKKTDIHVSKYPYIYDIHDIQVSTYPTIQRKSVSKTSKYPDIRKKWYPSIPTWDMYMAMKDIDLALKSFGFRHKFLRYMDCFSIRYKKKSI